MIYNSTTQVGTSAIAIYKTYTILLQNYFVEGEKTKTKKTTHSFKITIINRLYFKQLLDIFQ